MFSKPPFLQQVDKQQPTLLYAVGLQKAAASIGFDWSDVNGVIDKIHEELQEVSDEIATTAPLAKLQEELGDLLFACTNLARHLNIDPELALKQCNQKFFRRFSHVEQRVLDSGRQLEQCELAELDSYWDEAKTLEQK